MKIRRYAALAIAFTAHPPVVHAEAQTPTVLSVLALEAAAKPANPALNYDPVGETFRVLNLDASLWSQGERDARELAIRIQRERTTLDAVRAHYVQRVNAAEFVGRMTEGATLAAGWMTPANAAVAGAANIYSNYNISTKRLEFDAKTLEAQRAYQVGINDIARFVVGQATFHRVPGERLELAAQRYAEEVTNSSWFASMDKDGQDAVKPQLNERVKKLLEEKARVSRNEFSDLQRNLAANVKTVQNIQSDLFKLEGDLAARLDRSEKASKATLSGLAMIEKRIREGNDGRQADALTIQYMSWTQMPPRMKLEMLRNPTFMTDMPEREVTERNLEIVVMAQQANQYLTAVGDVANILGDIGLPIDSHGINRGVNLAMSGMDTYAAFATGQYSQGISSLSRLVAGIRNRPDAATSRHAAVMKQMQTVINLQLRTLEKLEALSKQVADSTERILADVNTGVVVSTLGVRLAEDSSYMQYFDRCRRFYKVAESDELINSASLFGTYEQRMKHFNAHASDYSDCGRLFKVAGALRAADPGEPSHLPISLWGYYLQLEPSAPRPQTPWNYQLNWYEPMLWLTRTAMASHLTSSGCSRRLVAQLSSVPSTLYETYSLQSACDPAALPVAGDNKKPGLHIRDFNDMAEFDATFAHVGNPTRTAEIARLLLFASPFDELITKTPAGDATLVAKDNLESWTVGEDVRDRLTSRYISMTNVLDVILAQQTVLSGALGIRYAVDNLKGGNYGFARTESVDMAHKWRNALASLASKEAPALWTYSIGTGGLRGEFYLPEQFDRTVPVPEKVRIQLAGLRQNYADTYLAEIKYRGQKDGYCPAKRDFATTDTAQIAATVVCLMDWNPQFARNVSLALFSDAIRAGGYDLTLVERFIQGNSHAVLSAALPGLPLVRSRTRQSPAQWGLRLLHPDGRELFIPIPSMNELEQARITYPHITYPLVELRETLLDRAVGLKAAPDLPKVGDVTGKSQLIRASWARSGSQLRVPGAR